ncbi:hypothetical protein VPH35_133667 [Triticum aestivum]
MASWKHQRNNNPRLPPASKTLPTDLLRAITVCSNARTIIRCAMTCRAASGVVPTCILLVYTRRRWRRSHARKVLIVLRHYHYDGEPENSDLCVYDRMTGERTFLSRYRNNPCVLLTAMDGIGCSSFMLLVADWDWSMSAHRCFLGIQTAALSDAGDTSWGPITDNHDAVVLSDGSIHWLLGDDILVYHVATKKLCTVKLPFMATMNTKQVQCHLEMPLDGRLRFVIVDRLMITMWMHLPSGRGQKQEAVINTKGKLQFLVPNIYPGNVMIEFEHSGERNGAVLSPGPLIILDLEMNEMRIQGACPSFLFEADMKMLS